MGDVVPVTIDRDSAQQLLTQHMPQAGHRVGGIGRVLDAVFLDDREHIKDVALLDDDTPVHIHFTETKTGITNDRRLRIRIDDAD